MFSLAQDDVSVTKFTQHICYHRDVIANDFPPMAILTTAR